MKNRSEKPKPIFLLAQFLDFGLKTDPPVFVKMAWEVMAYLIITTSPSGRIGGLWEDPAVLTFIGVELMLILLKMGDTLPRVPLVIYHPTIRWLTL